MMFAANGVWESLEAKMELWSVLEWLSFVILIIWPQGLPLNQFKIKF